MDVDCDIKYNNEDGIFFGGQKLSGEIIVKVFESVIVQSE
jgi:hypothetical protein